MLTTLSCWTILFQVKLEPEESANECGLKMPCSVLACLIMRFPENNISQTSNFVFSRKQALFRLIVEKLRRARLALQVTSLRHLEHSCTKKLLRSKTIWPWGLQAVKQWTDSYSNFCYTWCPTLFILWFFSRMLILIYVSKWILLMSIFDARRMLMYLFLGGNGKVHTSLKLLPLFYMWSRSFYYRTVENFFTHQDIWITQQNLPPIFF